VWETHPELICNTRLREYSVDCTLGPMETLTHAPVLARFGYAVSDPTRARILLALAAGPAYPSELAESQGVSRQSMSNHLTCLRGCGLVVAVPDGRRTRYELADARLGHAIRDLIGVVLAVDPACCAPDGQCLA
jgi:DNA-binding transcriptional ArsR family regulator